MEQSFNQRFEEFKSNGNLPSPRGVALKIIQLADNENTTTQQIARLINTDPALAGRIIKIANLLVRREGRPIASIEEAVTVQGIKSVRQLALSLSLISDFRSGACPAFDYQKFWAHSVCCGLAAQDIVVKMQIGVADEAFLIGLLSQIGRLALATIFPLPYSQVIEESHKLNNISELESKAFGLNHNQVSAMMLSEWGLSPFFHEIALYLEQPDASKHVEGGRGWRLLQLFHLADRLATLCTSDLLVRARQIPPLMLLATHDGIESNALVEIGDRVIVGLKEWGSLLGIETPQISSFDAMLNASSISSELTGLDALNGEPSPIYKLRILLVDDDRSIRLLYKTLLEKSGHTVTTACNGLEALELVRNCPPQLIISDWMMPEMDGIEFCRVLRQNPDWLNIYVFIVTAQESTEKLIEAFEAGANDYLSKPINPRVLSARLRSAQRIIQMQEIHEEDRHQLRQFADELALSNQRLQELALTDTLTGLYNRRYGMDRLEQEWAMSIRGERPFCCMMVDIDHFKLVNDTHGHQFGDQALRLVASSLQNAARKQDVVCRFGGEEFIVICPDTDLKAGMLCAERLRHSVAATPLISQGKAIRLTVSIGVTDSFQLKSAEVMLHQADKRLYVAKATGRNCTVGR